MNDQLQYFIYFKLCKATHYLHSGNVIHRDQKVKNIAFLFEHFLEFDTH